MEDWALAKSASRQTIESAIQDLQTNDIYDNSEMREAAYDAARTQARDLEYDELKELSVKGRRDRNRDLEKVVNPVLRERHMDRKFGDLESTGEHLETVQEDKKQVSATNTAEVYAYMD